MCIIQRHLLHNSCVVGFHGTWFLNPALFLFLCFKVPTIQIPQKIKNKHWGQPRGILPYLYDNYAIHLILQKKVPAFFMWCQTASITESSVFSSYRSQHGMSSQSCVIPTAFLESYGFRWMEIFLWNLMQIDHIQKSLWSAILRIKQPTERKFLRILQNFFENPESKSWRMLLHCTQTQLYYKGSLQVAQINHKCTWE